MSTPLFAHVKSHPLHRKPRCQAGFAGFLLLTALIFGATSSSFATEHDRLASGEILVKLRQVKGWDIPAATVRAVVEAPPAKVWPLIDRCSRYSKTMMRVKKSKELSRKAGVVRCRVVVDMPWPLDDLSAITRGVHVARANTYYQRKWTLETGDYRLNSGSWTLTPFDKAGKRTLVVYKAHAVPKISIPKWIQRAAAKRTFPKLMRHLRSQLSKP